jgi:hypothetical protein
MQVGIAPASLRQLRTADGSIGIVAPISYTAETDCVVGLVGFELRDVSAPPKPSYIFEMSG